MNEWMSSKGKLDIEAFRVMEWCRGFLILHVSLFLEGRRAKLLRSHCRYSLGCRVPIVGLCSVSWRPGPFRRTPQGGHCDG